MAWLEDVRSCVEQMPVQFALQDLLKELDLDIKQTIDVTLPGTEKLKRFEDLVKEECRASALRFGESGKPLKLWEIDGETVAVSVAGVPRVEARAA